jgi:hypothetical protein
MLNSPIAQNKTSIADELRGFLKATNVKVALNTDWGQDWDDWQQTKPGYNTSEHQLGYDPAKHAEGKGLITQNGHIWTWPTQDMRPQHMQYDQKLKQIGETQVPGTAFHIERHPNMGNRATVWQFGQGRSLSPEQRALINQADPRIMAQDPNIVAPQVQADQYGHAMNVLPSTVARSCFWATSAIVVADNYMNDSRNFPDPTAPRAAKPPEPLGCTCKEGQKLHCPVHGMNATEPDFDSTWSTPQAQPIGFPQDAPRTWQQAHSAWGRADQYITKTVEAMPMTQDRLQQHIQDHGPYMWHGIAPRTEIPPEDIAQSILREGLQPDRGIDIVYPSRDQSSSQAQYEYDLDNWWHEPRPGHVFMTTDPHTAYGDHLMRVDLRHLQPENFNPDDDYWRDNEIPGLPRPQWYWGDPQKDQQIGTLGEQAERLNVGGNPEDTYQAIQDSGIAGYRGTIPPAALTYIPPNHPEYPRQQSGEYVTAQELGPMPILTREQQAHARLELVSIKPAQTWITVAKIDAISTQSLDHNVTEHQSHSYAPQNEANWFTHSQTYAHSYDSQRHQPSHQPISQVRDILHVQRVAQELVKRHAIPSVMMWSHSPKEETWTNSRMIFAQAVFSNTS